jgi:predicted Zn-dependent protease
VDGTALWKQAASVGLAALLLLGGYAYGNARWDGSASVWQQADTALRAGNLEQAELILLGALRRSPRDLDALYNLAQIKLRQGKVAEAAGYLESANRVEPGSPDIQFALGLSYLELGRKTDGRPLLEAFLEQEPSGERADIARDALAR